MKKRRAQVSMEFLMTYGWAIMIVMIAIGALAYSGVFNTTNFIGDYCSIKGSIMCKDSVITSYKGPGNDAVTLKLENGVGKNIVIRYINITVKDSNPIERCVANFTIEPSPLTEEEILTNGATKDFVLSNAKVSEVAKYGGCPVDWLTDTRSGKVRFNIQVSWYFAASTKINAHSVTGDMLASLP